MLWKCRLLVVIGALKVIGLVNVMHWNAMMGYVQRIPVIWTSQYKIWQLNVYKFFLKELSRDTL